MRMAIMAACCLTVLVKDTARAQAGAPPAFEAASVKRTNPQAVGGGLRGGPGTDDPGQISYSNLPLASILMTAYHVQFFQISGPDWIKTERYDIAAKIPSGATQQQFDSMLQGLLAERLRIAVHHETRDFRAYELAAGKNGPKLKESAANVSPDQALPPSLKQLSPETRSMVLSGMPIATSRGVLMVGRARPIAELVDDLGMILGSPVVNKSSLSGKYDYTLEFERPQGAPSSAGGGGDPADSFPSIFTAVQEQLGLKLEEKKLPFDVLVIDHVERTPTDN
jgi:uncharacterized protein (TIGR03435 family)